MAIRAVRASGPTTVVRTHAPRCTIWLNCYTPLVAMQICICWVNDQRRPSRVRSKARSDLRIRHTISSVCQSFRFLFRRGATPQSHSSVRSVPPSSPPRPTSSRDHSLELTSVRLEGTRPRSILVCGTRCPQTDTTGGARIQNTGREHSAWPVAPWTVVDRRHMRHGAKAACT